MICCLRTRVRKQPIIVPYFEFETVLKFYNLEVRSETPKTGFLMAEDRFSHDGRQVFSWRPLFYIASIMSLMVSKITGTLIYNFSTVAQVPITMI